MTDHKPLPIAGYTDQSNKNIDVVNENKRLEELVLRQLDKMIKHNMEADAAGLGASAQFDPRFLSLARTNLQQAFMWMNRAVLKPKRLEGDLD